MAPTLPPGFVLDSKDGALPEGFALDSEAKDAVNEPHPDTTMSNLAKLANAIYGATPAGAVTNLPALARGIAGRPQPEGSSPTQNMANAVGSMVPGAIKGAANFTKNNYDIMAGAQGGAMIAAPEAAMATAASAPFLGPLAPLAGGAVLVGGAATGALGARGLRRIDEFARSGGKSDVTQAQAVSDLTQAAKEGAIQEAGGQLLEGGVKFGIEGARAFNGKAIEKAKEVLPDIGDKLLRIPTEAINRVFERFNDFSEPVKSVFNGQRRLAQSKADHLAEAAFTDLNNQLMRARRIAGKRLEYAEKSFINNAGDAPIVDAGDLSSAIKEWKQANPALADKEDIKLIEAAVNRYSPKPSPVTGLAGGQSITAKPAVALRRELDSLSHWDAGGVRAVVSDAADRLAKDLASYVRGGIRDTAQKVGGRANYVKRLEEFSTLADKHADAIEVLRTASNSDKALGSKMNQLTHYFNQGGLPQESILNIGKGVRGAGKIEKAVQQLADTLAARSFTRVPAIVPSSLMLRLINVMAPTRTAVSAAGAGLSGQAGAAAPYAVGPAGKAASRLAAALAAQQTR